MPDLLPTNSTRFERAVSQTTERVDAIPAPLRPLWRPDEIPERLLPYLAWAFSVDLWDSRWPLEKRRSVTARAVWLHRHKGTEAGIAAHIEIVGGRLKKAIVPPAKTFLMPNLTDDERERFLSVFAQLRVYPYVARGLAPYAHFTSKAHGLRKAFLGTGCLRLVSDFGRYTRTATMWDGGQETTLTIRAFDKESMGGNEAAAYDEVVLPARPSVAIFPGFFNAERRVRRMFTTDGLYVDQRLIRIPRRADYSVALMRETYTTVKPGVDLIDVRPRMIAQQHVGHKGSIFNGGGKQFIGAAGSSHTYIPPTDAWKFLFEQWHIHDPERVIEQRKRSIHLDNTRLGMPPYTAEITLAITGKAHPREAWRYVRDFLRTPNTEAIDRAAYATRVSKAARDKVLLQTKTFRPPRPGDRKKVGSLAIGQLIEV